MGAKVVLIEKTIRNGIMGGECLHTGCVPSKAMLASAKRAYEISTAERFGIQAEAPKVDFAAVNDHVQGVISAIGPIDSVARFESLGVTVLQAKAHFVNRKTVDADGVKVTARRFIIATGARPIMPPIRGLADVPYFTNETLFENRTLPEHLLIIGAGPIGMEMAQAHRRLGAKVTVLERLHAMPKDDPALVDVVTAQLREEGVILKEQADVIAVSSEPGGGIGLEYCHDGQTTHVKGSHLLLAVGRKPVIDTLDLQAGGIVFSDAGIKVNRSLRTSNRRVYALGDCAQGARHLTHAAGYQAGIIIRNVLFGLPAKSDLTLAPHVTYTEPELAHVGMTETQAMAAGSGKVSVTEWQYEENDRAQADLATQGFIKVVTRSNGRILGVSIAGAHAGEVIQPWLLAMSKKMKMSDMTGYIAPYPTYGEVNKRVAGQFFTASLFGPRVRAIVRRIQKLP
jgi:pyruvate/2-oxoglutarate dehydrogenase complex dihydrolipoamide dehydrogenase (E3) component